MSVYDKLLSFYDDPHAPRGAGDHTDGMVGVAGIKVFPLFLNDFGELGLRDLADFVFIGHTRSFGDAGLDLQERRSRWALAFKLERAVAIDRHDHRDWDPVELARSFVEL